MAEKRMYAKSIVMSDEFIEMSFSARCLYFSLGLFTDDDGFVNNPKNIMRQIGATQKDLDELFAHQYAIPFESGVIVITHFLINNTLRNDRYKATIYQTEKKKLTQKGGVYSLVDSGLTVGIPNDNQVTTKREPNITELNITQHNITERETRAQRADTGAGVHAGACETSSSSSSSSRVFDELVKHEPTSRLQCDCVCTLTEPFIDPIVKAFEQSEWLRLNIVSLQWVQEHLPKVTSGYYATYKQPVRATDDKAPTIPANINDLFTVITDDTESDDA